MSSICGTTQDQEGIEIAKRKIKIINDFKSQFGLHAEVSDEDAESTPENSPNDLDIGNEPYSPLPTESINLIEALPSFEELIQELEDAINKLFEE